MPDPHPDAVREFGFLTQRPILVELQVGSVASSLDIEVIFPFDGSGRVVDPMDAIGSEGRACRKCSWDASGSLPCRRGCGGRVTTRRRSRRSVQRLIG